MSIKQSQKYPDFRSYVTRTQDDGVIIQIYSREYWFEIFQQSLNQIENVAREFRTNLLETVSS